MATGMTILTCPRCGYDLQGQVDTWRVPLNSQADVVRFENGDVHDGEVGAKCPLKGTCSECGLAFEWKFVFRPELAGPGWFVETRRVSAVRAFFATALRLIFLLPFFHERTGVKIETPRHWERVVRYVAVCVVAIPAISFLLRQILGVVVLWQLMRKPLSESTYLVLTNTPKDLLHFITTLEFAGETNWFFVGACSSLGFALMMTVLPYTRAKAKVKMAHVIRAAAYSMTWVALPTLLEMLVVSLDCTASLLPAAPRRPAMTFDLKEFLRDIAADFSSGNFRMLLIGATAIWCYLYWWQVMRKWWRMEEAGIAYVACAVPVAMMVITALAYQYP